MKKRILLGLATATTLAMFAPTTAEAMEWFNQTDMPTTAEEGDVWTRNVGDGEDTFNYENSKWKLTFTTSERRKKAAEEQNALARQREEEIKKLDELRNSYMENAMENLDYYKDIPESEVEYVYIMRVSMTSSGPKRFNGTVRIPKVNIPERIPEYYGSVYVDEKLPELLPIVNVQPEYIPENENKEENNSEKHDEENNSSSITKNDSTEENNDSDKNNDGEINDHSNEDKELDKVDKEENNNKSNNIPVNTEENNDVTNDNPTSTDAGKTSIDKSNSDNDTTNTNNTSNSADKTGDKKDTSTKTENDNSKNTVNKSNTTNSNSNVGSSSKATSENTSTTTSSSSNTDKKLPKAGTNNNYTLFGFGLVMFSGIVTFVNKKRKRI